MSYCEKCMCLCEDKCPLCGKKKHLREVSEDDPVLVCAEDFVFSRLVADILKKNGIPCMQRTEQGGWRTVEFGYGGEYYRLYVPYRLYGRAKELVESIKPEDVELNEMTDDDIINSEEFRLSAGEKDE